MDDRDNIRTLPTPTASKTVITVDELRALLDASELGVLRQAALDVEDDLASFELRLADLPERSLKRLVGARAVWRKMLIDGSPAVVGALDDYERILAGAVDVAAIEAASKPAKRGKKQEERCSPKH